MKNYIPYSTQSIDNDDKKAVLKVLNAKLITQGPIVEKFERQFAKKVNSKHATACNSATSALHIACLALNFTSKDILWTVPNSFVASANCARLIGGKVDFVDIDPLTFNIDLFHLEKKLKLAKKKKKLPKILVPVHFAGQPPNQDGIYKLAKKYKFKILEDASHALGSEYKGEKVGSCKWSDVTVFSFHPVKTITSAEGGMVTTNIKDVQIKMQMFKNSGITKNKKFFTKKNSAGWYYEQQYLGLNYRMNEISAALGLSQLKKVGMFVKKRNKIANMYKKRLNLKNLILPIVNKNCFSSYHLFVIRINDKNYKQKQLKLFNFLRKRKILVNVHYLPIHLQPYYRKMGFKKGDFYNSEKHSESCLSIPIYPDLKLEEINKVIRLIKIFFKK